MTFTVNKAFLAAASLCMLIAAVLSVPLTVQFFVLLAVALWLAAPIFV